MQCPRPENVTQLRPFLGLVNYFQKMYLTYVSLYAHLLHDLLEKNTKWDWTVEHQAEFDKLKALIANCNKNHVFNPEEEVYLFTDASPYGFGVQLFNKDSMGIFKAVAWASASLTAAERQYSQFEKEELTLVYGVKKFHKFLYGLFFTVITDSIPMKLIFGEKKPFSRKYTRNFFCQDTTIR